MLSSTSPHHAIFLFSHLLSKAMNGSRREGVAVRVPPTPRHVRSTSLTYKVVTPQSARLILLVRSGRTPPTTRVLVTAKYGSWVLLTPERSEARLLLVQHPIFLRGYSITMGYINHIMRVACLTRLRLLTLRPEEILAHRLYYRC